jgi:hypothetical protein
MRNNFKLTHYRNFGNLDIERWSDGVNDNAAAHGQLFPALRVDYRAI